MNIFQLYLISDVMKNFFQKYENFRNIFKHIYQQDFSKDFTFLIYNFKNPGKDDVNQIITNCLKQNNRQYDKLEPEKLDDMVVGRSFTKNKLASIGFKQLNSFASLFKDVKYYPLVIENIDNKLRILKVKDNLVDGLSNDTKSKIKEIINSQKENLSKNKKELKLTYDEIHKTRKSLSQEWDILKEEIIASLKKNGKTKLVVKIKSEHAYIDEYIKSYEECKKLIQDKLEKNKATETLKSANQKLNDLIKVSKEYVEKFHEEVETQEKIDNLNNKISQLNENYYFGILLFTETILHEFFHSIIAHLNLVKDEKTLFPDYNTPELPKLKSYYPDLFVSYTWSKNFEYKYNEYKEKYKECINKQPYLSAEEYIQSFLRKWINEQLPVDVMNNLGHTSYGLRNDEEDYVELLSLSQLPSKYYFAGQHNLFKDLDNYAKELLEKK